MKPLFIVNPVSGSGKSLTFIKDIEDTLNKYNIEYDIVLTNYINHAKEIVEQENNDRIIYAVGGDGLINEIVNGMINKNHKLGIIPAGSGNDFYKSLDDRKEIISDVGQVNDSYFINIASFGFDAEVNNEANRLKEKNIPANLIYQIGLLVTLIKNDGKKLLIKVNDEIKMNKYTLTTICNGRFYGGGFEIAPNAKIDDGLFDVYIANYMNRLKLIKTLLKLKKGEHEKDYNVEKIETTEIKVLSKDKITANIDGQISKIDCMNIKLIPSHITIHNDKELVNEIVTNNLRRIRRRRG